MKKFYLLSLGVTFLLSNNLSAQVEDEACLPPSKKIMKIIEEGKNAPDAATAITSFNKAIEENPDNATPYYEFAMYAFNKGKEYMEKSVMQAQADKNYKKSREMFLETIKRCSDYHANCYYYLGVIAFNQNDLPEAVKWLKEFKNYKSKNNDRYPDDYDKKLADVNNIIPELEAEINIKTNKVPFDPMKVPNVSSRRDEYFPMISPDNEIMFFTRKDSLADYERKRMDLVYVENFTLSHRKSVAELFDNGKKLGVPFNDGSFTNYGAATMSVDNKEMIICACKPTQYSGQSYLNCDLYRTEYERTGTGGNDFTWTPLENLGTEINTPNGWEGQPSLSADGQTLFYTVTRPNSRDNDILIAHKMPNGKWGKVEQFKYNTEGKDKSPFLHQDSETLYFVSQVSDEQKGVGGLDIFYTRWDANVQNPDGTKGNWGKPKNIGYPINTEADELGVFVSTDGTLAYYSSRYGGDWNIYAFELYEEARPTGVTILKGELKDDQGNPITNAEIEVAYAGTGEVTKVKVNGNDGKFATVVKNNTHSDVLVTVKKDGHAFDSKLITKEQLETTAPKETNPVANKSEENKQNPANGASNSGKANEVAQNDKPIDPDRKVMDVTKLTQKPKDVSIRGNNLTAKPLEVGQAYTINDILFATNSYELNDRSKFILKQFANYLKENAGISIAIHGHTDDVGDDQQNMLLSEGRANAVKQYLISLGIAESRLSSKGFGETVPKLPNTTDVNRAKNRRTDFVIEKID